MKFIQAILLLCLLTGWNNSVRAGTCTTITPQVSTLSVGTINVQRDAPVGTVVFSGAATYTGSYLTGCSNPLMLGFSMRYNNATLSSYGNHVYNTNISGIGIRFSSNYVFENPANTFSYNAQTSYVDWYGGTIELVVTGPVSSGALTPGVIGVVMLQGSDGVYRDGLTTQLTSGTINALACSITTPQLTFPIGDISASAFGTAIGTTPAGAQNTQNLGLTCTPGTNISVSLGGIQNPDSSNTALMKNVVWVTADQGEPAWAVGGTYQAVRIIQFHVEFWDRTPLKEQQTIFGRDKQSGAPLGMQHEHDVPDYASDPDGNTIALDSHIRLANPRTKETQSSLMMRRGYSYSLGVTNSGQLDMGLLFVCYQHDLEKGFLTVQKRLNGEALEEYIKPIGGGYFFALPGARDRNAYLAQGLIEA